MRLLVDTQLLLWAAAEPDRVSQAASDIMNNDEHEPHYNVVSLWEVTIKNALGRPDFRVDNIRLRRRLRQAGYSELVIEAEHVLIAIPRLHKDPFDRLLVAQASVERLTLLTADRTLSRYAEYAAVRVV